MSISLRSTLVLSLAICLLPAAAMAQQLRQPASVLPLVRLKPAQERGIVAPQVDEVPRWLLQATELPTGKSALAKKVARKTTRRQTLTRVETDDFDMLGDIRLSTPKHDGVGPTRNYRPEISPVERSPEGPELRIPGIQRAKISRSSKRLR